MSTNPGKDRVWPVSSWTRWCGRPGDASGRELWLGVWERNLRAQAFYRKHGFRKVGTQIFVVGTDPQTDHVMLRELE